MMKELVCGLGIKILISSLKAVQVNYRGQVVAKTVGTTPLIRHVFKVLKARHQAKVEDAIPWQHIKNWMTYIPPPLASHPMARPSSTESYVRLPMLLLFTSQPPTCAPLLPPQPCAIPEGPTDPIAQMATLVQSRMGSDLMVIGAKQEPRMTGKGPVVDEAMAEAAAPQTKHHKISPQMVPAHHLVTEDEYTPPLPKQQKNKAAMLRMIVNNAIIPPDQLWKTCAECPSAMCDNCKMKRLPICRTTALQIVCAACYTGKTKCLYSASHIACQEAMIASGELPPPKGVKKSSGRKKVQEDKGCEAKGKGGKAAGKRKWSETANEDSVAKTGLVSAVASPLIVPPVSGSGSAALPYCLDIEALATLGTTSQCPPTPQAVTHVGNAPASRVGQTPTLASLQWELTDVQSVMATFKANQETLMNDNVILQSQVEVLMELKDQMLVSVPVLQGEMRGLRDGMELERIKHEITMLQH